MQLPPSAALSSVVKHYLILESGRNIHSNYRLFSDGNPGIVFHYKNPLKQLYHNGATAQLQPRSFAYGQITHYYDLIATGSLGMVVVVLHPYSINSLFRVSADELNNGTIDLVDFYGSEVHNVEDKIHHAKTSGEIIAVIEKFLLKKTTAAYPNDATFSQAISLIYQHKGIITVEGLLKAVPVTERQLQRKFKYYIGINPKKFADVIKLQHFLKLLKNHPPDDKLAGIVYDSGYYDQSHLNNWFKKTAGITPLQYRDNSNLLAVNLMQM
jgi:AraC-like DNA-binding protein